MLYVTAPTTILSEQSTIDTHGNLSKLRFIVHVLLAVPWVNVNVVSFVKPDGAIDVTPPTGVPALPLCVKDNKYAPVKFVTVPTSYIA